jgi:hypothetical protein
MLRLEKLLENAFVDAANDASHAKDGSALDLNCGLGELVFWFGCLQAKDL